MPAAVKTLSEAALAAAMKVDRSAVQQWRRAGCPHRRVSGRFEYVESEVWEWRLERAKARQSDEDIDEAKERARKMKADADLAEARLAKVRGEQVPVAAVLRSDERLHGIIRARVTAIRGKWAPRVLGLGTMPEATAVLDALAAELLASLEEGANELDADEQADAA